MSDRFAAATARAAAHHGVISSEQLAELGVSPALRSVWVQRERLRRLGPRSFAVAGVPVSWIQQVAAAALDLRGRGVIAGRAAGRLHGFDGFGEIERIEALVARRYRNIKVGFRVRSVSEPLIATDICRRESIVCLTPERTILEAPLFRFTTREVHRRADGSRHARDAPAVTTRRGAPHGYRVIAFTYDDVVERPDWVVATLVAAIGVTDLRAGVDAV